MLTGHVITATSLQREMHLTPEIHRV